jgi:hypothetical protein
LQKTPIIHRQLIYEQFLEDFVEPSILSTKADLWNQEVHWKSINKLLAGACKSIEVTMTRHDSTSLEINQSCEAKVTAEQAPGGFYLPEDPK